MSLIPRRERSDAERRRLARKFGLRPSATWSEVDCALIDWRDFRRLAESYGLEEDATWDDVYAAFRRRYDQKWATITAAYYAAIPGAILLLVWMHWITIIIALLILLVNPGSSRGLIRRCSVCDHTLFGRGKYCSECGSRT